MATGERTIKTRPDYTTRGDFLPDLCNVQAVFTLVLVGELLALALTLAATGLEDFSWPTLGKVSFLVLWIVLVSAACLCPLRPWLAGRSSLTAGTVCYLIVMTVAALCSLAGSYLMLGDPFAQPYALLTTLIITSVFAGVALRYFYLQQQLRNQQQAELVSRFQALQSRIRPHFLFNSMNTIASLIAVDPATAEKMVVNLSHLMRASLSETSIVPLEKELQLCREYAALEKLRLGDRLRVHWELPDDTGGREIPSLLLQPLIENAIYHGVQPLAQGGDINVQVELTGSETRIAVANPVPVDKPTSVAEQGNGLALENIRNRLLALYGDAGVLQVDASESQFRVSVRYPAKEVGGNPRT